jgi:DNA-binding transcriptional LysR family regulator
VRLLQRTTRALSLTADGEAFYSAARRIVAEIEALETEMTDQRGTPHGLLRVTTSLAFATHQLAPMIGEFLERYPEIQLELMPTDRVVDMIDEGVDIAIRIGKLADSSFMARKIGDDVRLVCAAPAYLASHPAPKRPEDLARHNCIVSRDRAYLNRWHFRIDGQVREIEVGGRIAVSDGEAQMRLALQGLGIVRLTRLTVAGAIKRGELVSLLGDYSAEEPVPIHAVYPHRKHLASKVTAFVEFILEKFTPPPWEI